MAFFWDLKVSPRQLPLCREETVAAPGPKTNKETLEKLIENPLDQKGMEPLMYQRAGNFPRNLAH